VVKEEANEALEDTAPPGAGNLPPEYHAILAVGYDEDTLLQQVLEAYKANEDARFPNLQEALTLTGMVAEHLASMPPPHPLSAHTSPQAAYLRQEVPPPSGVPPRRHRQDHPHGLFINPPQPQPEVVVNLVSDDEE
jgi:hypothetical protein